jgi:DNA topoisomerase VI subunit B
LEAEEAKIARATEKMKMSEPTLVEEIDTAVPEASSKLYDYIVRHASRKNYRKKKFLKLIIMPKN